MAPRVDWLKKLAAAAARIDRAEAAADKAARALQRVTRPETIRKYERAGKAAEARRRTAERDFRAAERRLLGAPKRERKQPAPPSRPSASYMVTISYRGRRGHGRYVEFVLHGPPGSTATDVRRAVNRYAQRKDTDGWSWSALRYGSDENNASSGRVRDLDELQGLLMQERSVTVGEL